MQNIRAQVHLPTTALAADIGFFKTLGLRMDRIFPADNPRTAVFSGHGLRLRLDVSDAPSGTIAHPRRRSGADRGRGDRTDRARRHARR